MLMSNKGIWNLSWRSTGETRVKTLSKKAANKSAASEFVLAECPEYSTLAGMQLLERWLLMKFQKDEGLCFADWVRAI